MTYIRVTHTVPDELAEILNRLDKEQGVNKSAFVTLAIQDRIKKLFPDYVKEPRQEE